MSVDWDSIRKEQFPALEKGIHLKAAGGSPMCKAAYSECIRFYNDLHKLGDIFWDDYYRELTIVRNLVANYINCSHNEVAFLVNTSSGINVIAHLIEKGQIIYPESEFPASILPFKFLGFNCKEISPLVNNIYSANDIQKNLNLHTKYIVHSHVQYLSGFKQNLDELGKICQEYGIINIINATQSFGAFSIDVTKQKVDMLVSSGLKWACSGYGIGILFIKNKHLRRNDLPFASWLSVTNAHSMNNRNLNFIRNTASLDGFGGTPNFAEIFALKGSLNLIKDIGKGNINKGIELINNRIIQLTSEFLEQIQKINFKIITPLDLKYRSGIITIENDKAESIYHKLLSNKIYISLRNYPDLTKKTLLRFSFNFYNSFEDIKTCLKILKEI